MMEPYKGLQPYTEDNEDIFFGRDAEKAILIDKILSGKLTLLFAATGVGKSSLLQAAVMPELKRPAQENLDVVYYNDWVSPPLVELKKTILEVLQKEGKLGTEFRLEENFSLQEFLHICATFASEPLVIILDQFEEFFQYQRYTDAFTPFIAELSEAIRDRDSSVAFLISMREDFALNLNTFKEHLPTILFENYFRLEKLGLEEAGDAIKIPVEKIGFKYEQGLVPTLLKDLADQEREGRFGMQKAIIPEHAPTFVEPPNVQIVCTQLWDLEKGNPDKVIRTNTYNGQGKATGFIKSYFHRIIAAFSSLEKKLASKAFDHLVTPHGTKMAYPVKDLSELLRVDEHDLGTVLAKLEKARVLRTQSREGVIWYELYHDTFSDIIYQWNDAYKTKQRNKRTLIGTGVAVFALLILFAVYDIVTNFTNHHLRLSSKRISNQVELYRGKANSLDIAHLQRYEVETSYKRSQIEPDKQFVAKPVNDYDDLNLELISQLPTVKRISTYWKTGKIDKALELADNSIGNEDMTRTQAVINLLVGFRSQRSLEILDKHLHQSENVDIRKDIINALGLTQFAGVTKSLTKLLADQNQDVRESAAKVLGQLGSDEAIGLLVELLKDQSSNVRGSAAEALGELGNKEVVGSLVELLKDQNAEVRSSAAKALGQLDSDEALGPLVELLKDQSSNVRSSVAEALGELGNKEVVGSLVELLKDQNAEVRRSVVWTLGQLGSEKRIVESLVELLKDPDLDVQGGAAEALYRLNRDEEALILLRSSRALELLVKFLKETNKKRSFYYYGGENDKTEELLIQLNSDDAVDLLVKLLEDQDSDVRGGTAATLGRLGNTKALEPLVELLKDPNWRVRSSVAGALGKLGSSDAVEPLIELLDDPNWTVQQNVVEALGGLGSDNAVGPLMKLLKDQNRNENVRREAAISVGQLANDDIVDPLLELIEDQNLSMRNNAAAALGRLSSGKAVIPLMKLMKEQNWYTYFSAVIALSRLGSGNAVEPLMGLLNVQDWRVRYNAMEVLDQIGGNEVVEVLLEELENPSPFSDLHKIGTVLAQLGSSEAVNSLLRLLKRQYIPVGPVRFGISIDEKRRAIEALGQFGSTKAVNHLVELLKNRNDDIRGSAAKALGQIGNSAVVDSLVELLKYQDAGVQHDVTIALGKLLVYEAIIPLKELYKKESLAKLTVAAVLLSFDQEDGIDFLRKKSRSKDSNEQKKVAEILGEVSSKQGNEILLSMFNDENIDVKIQVITSLGHAQAKSSLPRLHAILAEAPIPKTRKTVVEALGEIASTESIDLLRQTALDTEERVTIRIAAITGLGKIGTEEAVVALREVLEKVHEHYHYKTIIALGKTRSKKALSALLEHLEEQERHKARWRKIRDEDTNAYDQEQTEKQKKQMEDWRKREEAVRPKTYLEFELAYAIVQIDPEDKGVKLLSHDLAKVREGAWTGLARLPLTETRPFYLTDGPAAVKLIERLDRERIESKEPLFRHAAYRAIDGMLITIETYGSTPELRALEAFLPEVRDLEGVLTRVEWTIYHLREREEEEE